MRNKYARCLLPMNIQFFAEPDGADEGGTAGGGEGSQPPETPSFDDFLKDENNQKEFNRRIQEAVTAAQEKWQLMTDDKVSEAEKLAKMTKEEKAEYLRKKQEKELADREAKITRRELMAEAKNTLTEKKLPVGLAEVLNYTDADSCNKSIAAVEKAFNEAVEAGVQERLKGGTPPKKEPESEDTLAKQVENLMRGI